MGVKAKAEDETSIKIEVGGGNTYEIEQTGADTTEKAVIALSKARDTILKVAKEMIDGIQKLDRSVRPSEVDLEFGIMFSATGDAVVIKGTSEANFKVSLKFQIDNAVNTSDH